MEPRLEIEPFTLVHPETPWRVSWTVRNRGPRAVRLLSAMQPHSQFRTEETRIARDVAPSSSDEVELPVRFDEPPGTIVENPFLILRFADGPAEYRALARVRVAAGARGEPTAAGPVVLTVQRVGLGGA